MPSILRSRTVRTLGKPIFRRFRLSDGIHHRVLRFSLESRRAGKMRLLPHFHFLVRTPDKCLSHTFAGGSVATAIVRLRLMDVLMSTLTFPFSVAVSNRRHTGRLSRRRYQIVGPTMRARFSNRARPVPPEKARGRYKEYPRKQKRFHR
jgi:hypothetical protein